jgi:inosine/xanthosine triphosphate pyrophosphatase family protein
VRLVLATSNPAKVERLRWLLAGVRGVEFVVAETALAVAEGEDALCENASTKARAYAVTYCYRSVATDGGVDVPALNGRWNPVLTGRNAAQLLDLARDLHDNEREAFQVECVAVADERGQIIGAFESRSTARLLARVFDPRGLPRGFWVPGVLLYGPDRKRFADLSPVERESLADDHWLALRERVSALIAAEVTRLPGGPARQARS